MSYTQPAGTTPATLELTVTADGLKKMLNENDNAGTLQIYNAKATGLDTANYTVSATIDGTVTPLADAVYVQSSDRLVATLGTIAAPADLTKVTKVTLTRKA